MAATDTPLLLAAAALLLAGCPDDAPAPWVGDEPPGDDGPPAAPLPEGLEVPDGHLFSVDSRTSAYAFPVDGAPGVELVGQLAGPGGQRRILYGPVGAATEVLAEGWLLPPVAAADASGRTIACWNELTGGTTDLTEGSLPDPTQGLSLLCRLREGEVWGAATRLGSGFTASWLKTIEAQGAGSFRVAYYADGGLFVRPTSADDGDYAQLLGPAGPGEVELVARVDPDLLDDGRR